MYNSMKPSCFIKSARLAYSLLVALSLFVLPPPCFGQQTSATLVGTVTDASGAVLPNVVVRATHLATNAFREAQTDASGTYSIPFLAAGAYTLTATLAGFQTQRIDRLSLQIQQTARMDFQLVVGEVTETVDVSASTAGL